MELKGRDKLGRFMKGFKHTQESKSKMSLHSPKIWLGKNLTQKTKNKISLAKMGVKLSEKTKHRMSLSRKGKKHWNWQGGKSPLFKLIKSLQEYKNWRKNIFERDNYICQNCGLGGSGVYLHPHHNIKRFSVILYEFLKQYSQFSPMEDKETLIKLATTYEPFWDINNGITLCYKCHIQTKSCHNRVLMGG